MVEARRASLVLGLLSLAAGCGDGPPLDELPLRDALRAEPAVVAALPAPARAQLAARLEAARTGDGGSDSVASGANPGALVGALDDARARRSADALIVGAIGGGVGRPIATAAASSDQQSLPPLEGLGATDTAGLEARALAGAAGGPLRGLLAYSGASRLERVVGWPAGAVAIGDTVYVDASWLVALAPADDAADGGADARGAGVVGGGGRPGGGRHACGGLVLERQHDHLHRLRIFRTTPGRTRRRHRRHHLHLRRTTRVSGTPARPRAMPATAATPARRQLVRQHRRRFRQLVQRQHR